MSGLPHASGGVSARSQSFEQKVASSPRTWGCFQLRSLAQQLVAVFPTHVGVFLDIEIDPLARERLPHARGGVSPCSV